MGIKKILTAIVTAAMMSAVFINAIAQTTNGSALKFRLRKNNGSNCEVIKPGQSCSILIDEGGYPQDNR